MTSLRLWLGREMFRRVQPLLPPLPLLRLALAAEALPRLVRPPLAAVLAAEALRRLARPPLVAEVSLATLSFQSCLAMSHSHHQHGPWLVCAVQSP